MKDHLHYYRADSGKKLTQKLSTLLLITNVSYKGLKNEVDVSREVIRNVLLFKDGIEEGVSAQSFNLFEQIANGEMVKRTP